jgi:hypothetical protein
MKIMSLYCLVGSLVCGGVLYADGTNTKVTASANATVSMPVPAIVIAASAVQAPSRNQQLQQPLLAQAPGQAPAILKHTTSFYGKRVPVEQHGDDKGYYSCGGWCFFTIDDHEGHPSIQ